MKWRMFNVLADGRRVYVSKRGKVHLVSKAAAENWMAMSMANRCERGPIKKLVYAKDLGSYGNLTLYLESLTPYVATANSGIESESAPIDPGAYVLGGILATEAGATG
jgi:hypothetical protein